MGIHDNVDGLLSLSFDKKHSRDIDRGRLPPQRLVKKHGLFTEIFSFMICESLKKKL